VLADGSWSAAASLKAIAGREGGTTWAVGRLICGYNEDRTPDTRFRQKKSTCRLVQISRPALWSFFRKYARQSLPDGHQRRPDALLKGSLFPSFSPFSHLRDYAEGNTFRIVLIRHWIVCISEHANLPGEEITFLTLPPYLVATLEKELVTGSNPDARDFQQGAGGYRVELPFGMKVAPDHSRIGGLVSFHILAEEFRPGGGQATPVSARYRRRRQFARREKTGGALGSQPDLAWRVCLSSWEPIKNRESGLKEWVVEGLPLYRAPVKLSSRTAKQRRFRDSQRCSAPLLW